MPYICAVIPQPSGTLSTDQGKQRPGWITLLGATGHPVADSNEWSAEMEYYSSALLWCFCFGFSALLLLLRFSALLLTSLAFSPFFFPSLSSCLAAFPRSASWYSYFFFFLVFPCVLSACLCFVSVPAFFSAMLLSAKKHRSNSSLFCFSPLNIYHITWVFFIIWSIVLAFPLNTFYLYHSNLFCLFLFFFILVLNFFVSS